MRRGSISLTPVIVTFFSIAAFLGVMWFALPKNENKNTNGNTNAVACTEEAKLCPDGSAVGRTGPNCEFAECPDVNANTVAAVTDDWKTYKNSLYSYSLRTPSNYSVYPFFEIANDPKPLQNSDDQLIIITEDIPTKEREGDPPSIIIKACNTAIIKNPCFPQPSTLEEWENEYPMWTEDVSIEIGGRVFSRYVPNDSPGLTYYLQQEDTQLTVITTDIDFTCYDDVGCIARDPSQNDKAVLNAILSTITFTN